MLGKAFKNIYLIFAAVLTAVVLGGTVVVAVFYNINVLHIILSIAVWAAAFIFMLRYADNKAVVWCVVLLGAILRVIYAICCTQPPESDFKLYYDMASAFAEGNFNISSYARMFPHVTGYSALLGVWFRLFGTSIVSARISGVLFDMLTLLFLCLTARRLFGKKAAGFTAFLFSLSPSVILYCGLICTEKASVMLVLLFLFIITHIIHKPLLSVCLCAATAAAANLIRPNGVILLITLVLVCIALLKIKKKYLYVLLALAMYFVTTTSFNAVVSHTFGEVASNPTGWNLYVGFNTESYGQWNEQDATQLDEIMNSTGSDNAHKLLRAMAKERVMSNSLWGNTKLLCSKYAVMWSNDIAVCSYLKADELYNTMYATFSAEAVISGFYVAFMLAVLFAAIILLKKKEGTYIAVMLVVLGTAAMHLLSEVMGRYAYPGIICMFVLCGVAAEKKYKFFKKKVLTKITWYDKIFSVENN